jgi:hypothetical protein
LTPATITPSKSLRTLQSTMKVSKRQVKIHANHMRLGLEYLVFKVASGYPDCSLEMFLKLKELGWKFRIPKAKYCITKLNTTL